MSRRTDYKTCPYCGAHLDAGERCDCEAAATEAEAQKGEINHVKSA